jgi:hypothetical protein
MVPVVEQANRPAATSTRGNRRRRRRITFTRGLVQAARLAILA